MFYDKSESAEVVRRRESEPIDLALSPNPGCRQRQVALAGWAMLDIVTERLHLLAGASVLSTRGLGGLATTSDDRDGDPVGGWCVGLVAGVGGEDLVW